MAVRNPKKMLKDRKVVDRICEELVDGKGIVEILQAEDLPSVTTFYEALREDEDLRNRIAHAREAQQDAEVDRMIALADEADEVNWQVKKLQIWARQWRAAKLAPKKYGDKQTHQHEGSVNVQVVTGVPQAEEG